MQAQISDLRRTKRGRFSVYLEGAFHCVLHEEIYAASGLQPGALVELDELDELRLESQEKFAKEKALQLLSARSYTAQMLYQKLCQKFDEDGAQGAVERMIELGLVDDEDYARRFAADCVHLKSYSYARIARELAAKGVDRDIIQAVLEERDDDPRGQIARLVERKYLRQLGDERGVQRTTAALQRLGFRYGDIKAVLGEYARPDDE